MTEYEKMMNGQAFAGADPEISLVRDNALKLTIQINTCDDFVESQSLLKNLFDQLDDTSIVKPPFYCEFGKQITIGKNTFINMGVTMLDGAKITIGNNVMIGPSSQFYTASHSLNHLERRHWETYCHPITIEDDVWIGGNVVINQGVTIGARSVIAANSVVNKDVPPDTLVGGTPAKVIKSLL
ncbi:sugar O-acetyltransferase [Parendozoicomonas haliclonae]|uniref:Nodulation protein L n=1 Tax=Parendozoicomonas haliclonae TaxID=1960125 RepID=A0A1X7AJR1_9GAMM|nr:sugar O-acetyltransferase [Parendozoicomonas haliclonae]SMA47103.1 Maltose O-acetyltransferase [Parendozoicomonas haliclonae]